MAASATAEKVEYKESRRQMIEAMRGQMDQERQPFVPMFKDLGDFILPMRPRFTTTEGKPTDRSRSKILNSVGSRSLRTFRSGMVSAVMSQARQWFRLTVSDKDLAENWDVKTYLAKATDVLLWIFSRSNVYKETPQFIQDIGTFATGAMYVKEDVESILHFKCFPIGTYFISANAKGKVDCFIRDFRMTVRQIVEKFGRQPDGTIDWTNISAHVKNHYVLGTGREFWIDVCHAIYPNDEYSMTNKRSKFKRYRSTYYERGTGLGGNGVNYLSSEGDVAGYNKTLRESGYDWFPVLVTRWEVSGDDVWGTESPGMVALPDIRALQTMEKRYLQALEKLINPPMRGPTSLRNKKTTLLPGDVTLVDVTAGGQTFEPSQEIRLDLSHLEQKMNKVAEGIEDDFYVKLFLMIISDDRNQRATATEVEEGKDEKVSAVSPLLENLNDDFFRPLIDIAYSIADNLGLLPDAPDALDGHELKVEYLSVMAQIARLAGIGSIERFSQFVGAVFAQTTDPSVLDNLDIDQMIDRYADRLGIDPDLVRSKDVVKQIRAARQQAQQEQAAVAKAGALAKGAADLSKADMNGNNALTQIVNGAGRGAPAQAPAPIANLLQSPAAA